MQLKVVALDGVNHIIACHESGPIIVWDRELTIYCHNLYGMVTFSEVLSVANFQTRLKNLNPRVRFPDSDVREALMSNNPVQASLSEPNPAGVRVLFLKYSLAESPVPLKWEWYLKPVDTGIFYREVFVSAATLGEELLDMVATLTEQLCAKDVELEQYRREGCQLRRTTVRTKPFNVEDFNDVNKECMAEAASYRKINTLYNNTRYVPSTPTTPTASSNASERPSPASGSSSSSSRSRKRKAQESNTNHLERKVKQRRNQPNIEYKNSQSSQEDALIDWLVENKPPTAVEEEPVLEPAIKKKTETPQGFIFDQTAQGFIKQETETPQGFFKRWTETPQGFIKQETETLQGSIKKWPETPQGFIKRETETPQGLVAEALQWPKATVKTEINSEEPVKAKPNPVEEQQKVNDDSMEAKPNPVEKQQEVNNESVEAKPNPVEKSQEMNDDSDQELNELRSILGHTMGQTLSKQEE